MEYQPTKSTIAKDLRRQYALRRFISLTEAGKEALWGFVSFLLATSTIAYFGAHYIIFIVNNSK